MKDEDIYGLDICVATPCRCGCPLIRAHPHSVKSKIPIWKCVWCQKRRGKPTDNEFALMKAWLRKYGYTLEPLGSLGVVGEFGVVIVMPILVQRVGDDVVPTAAVGPFSLQPLVVPRDQAFYPRRSRPLGLDRVQKLHTQI